MQVRAKELGYYNHERRRAGVVFEIKGVEHFSPRWMEPFEPSDEEMKAIKARVKQWKARRPNFQLDGWEEDEKGEIQIKDESPKKKRGKKSEDSEPELA